MSKSDHELMDLSRVILGINYQSVKTKALILQLGLNAFMDRKTVSGVGMRCTAAAKAIVT